MTDLKKRTLLQAAALAAAVAGLSACSKQETPAPAPAPAPTAAAPAAAPAPAAPLKIAFAYVGPVGDGGWTFAHDNGRKAVEKEFGSKVVTSFVEKVPESADAERVIRDMVGQGNKLVFGTTFATWRPARVLLGAYLFGGVTMLQFHLQGTGVEVASEFLNMLPYVATIVVLALISRNPAWIRINMPASLGKPFYPGT